MDPSPRTSSHRARSLLAAIGQDAAFAWRTSPRAAIALAFAPWAGAALLAGALADGKLFRFLTGSGSVLAWLAVAAWIAAGAFAAASSRQLWMAHRDRDVAGFAALTLLCGLVAGQTHRQPALENLAALLPALLAVIGCYGAVAPWLARRRRPSELMRLAVPPLFLSSTFLMLAVYEAVHAVVPGATVDAFRRWPELCLALAVATFARLTQQRLRRASTPVLLVVRAVA